MNIKSKYDIETVCHSVFVTCSRVYTM